MSLVALPGVIEYPSKLFGARSLLWANDVIDATGEMVANICLTPKSGNIRKIGILTGTVTTPQTLDCRIETLGTDGNPSGSLWAVNTNGSQATPASNTWYWVTLTADAAVTAGDYFAIVINYTATVGNLSMIYRITGLYHSNLYSTFRDGAGTWFRNAGQVGAFAVEFADGSRTHVGTYPASVATPISEAINTGTTPDEVGILFSLPFTAKCVGAVFRTIKASTTVAVKLYDSDGTTVLESKTGIDLDIANNATNEAFYAMWDTQVTLSANTNYRITLLPEAATSITVYRVTVDSAGTRDAWPGGDDFQKTHRTDAGEWTNTTTQIPQIALLLSHLDDGSGGGAGGGGHIIGGGM